MNIERLKKLASGLRKLAPEQYNHRDMLECALGHCGRIFPELNTNYMGFNEAGRFFGITYDETSWLFNDEQSYTLPDKDVTPEMVADRIDAFLAY